MNSVDTKYNIYLYRFSIYIFVHVYKNLKYIYFFFILTLSIPHKTPRNICWAAIYPRFLRYHQALSMLPPLHPWRFLGQQEIKFWGDRLAVYLPLDWIAIRSAATPVSNKILVNIKMAHDISSNFHIPFYFEP